MCKVVHKNQPHDVYIGRPSVWGNPFSHKPSNIAEFHVKDKETAIAEYKKWILKQPQILKDLYTLKGKTLGCWCAPANCHGDVLVELVNRTKIAVVGSRGFADPVLLEHTLDWMLEVYPDAIIISGGATGADRYASNYAKVKNIELIEFLPDWDNLGKKAGFIRNEYIVNNCDILVAFWDGSSKGTQHDLNIAKKLKKPTFIYYF